MCKKINSQAMDLEFDFLYRYSLKLTLKKTVEWKIKYPQAKKNGMSSLVNFLLKGWFTPC